MSPDQLETLRAAVRVKLGLHLDELGLAAMVRGLPKRHAVECSLMETADFILRSFATGEGETVLLTRKRRPHDDDYP